MRLRLNDLECQDHGLPPKLMRKMICQKQSLSYLPKVANLAAAKPHQVNAPNYSRNSHKESYGSNDMVHAYFLEDARKMTQDKTRIPNHRDMASTRAHCTPNACTPKPRNIYRSSPVSKWNSRAKVQSLKIRNNNPVELKNHTHKPGRQIGIGQRFSLNKSSAVHEKPHTPRSCLRWKPTGRIFKTVSLRWIPTGKMFTDSTTKVDSEPPNGSNDDITNPYECNQTLYFSAGTSNSSAEVARRILSSTFQLDISRKLKPVRAFTHQKFPSTRHSASQTPQRSKVHERRQRLAHLLALLQMYLRYRDYLLVQTRRTSFATRLSIVMRLYRPRRSTCELLSCLDIKKRSSNSSKKLKGIQTLTPAKQEAADIMKALKESKKISKRQPRTGGSNEGTGNILGVPDESTVISRASSQGIGSKPGVPDEEKLILSGSRCGPDEQFLTEMIC
ncbi:hypothetical protein Tco_0528991 [Tanacetum coccineum]